jgi:asparagine synthetase B (glutamine-hydrolysing)
MCGILCIVTCEGRSIDCGVVEHAAVVRVPETPVDAHELTHASFDSTLARRGPDAVERALVACSGASVELSGSLLQLRGATATQALKRSGQCVLCFNGELYGGLPIGEAENDGDALFAALAGEADIVTTLSRLQGPWAFVFWDGDTLWFGRDVFGRRRHAMMGACLSMLFTHACCPPQPAHPQANRRRCASAAFIDSAIGYRRRGRLG